MLNLTLKERKQLGIEITNKKQSISGEFKTELVNYFDDLTNTYFRANPVINGTNVSIDFIKQFVDFEKLDKLLNKNYKKIQNEFSGDIRKSADLNSSFINGQIDDDLIDFREQRLPSTSTQITQTYAKRFSNYLTTALFIDGLSPNQKKTKAKININNDNVGRSTTISLNETQATSQASVNIEKNAINNNIHLATTLTGFIIKNTLVSVWNSSFLPTTRTFHANASGQKQQSGFFTVGGEFFRYPGDSLFSSIENYINCYCFLTVMT